jgi:hypothetical protein
MRSHARPDARPAPSPRTHARARPRGHPRARPCPALGQHLLAPQSWTRHRGAHASPPRRYVIQIALRSHGTADAFPEGRVASNGGRHGTLLCMVWIGHVGSGANEDAGELRDLQRMRGGARTPARGSGAPAHVGHHHDERRLKARRSVRPPSVPIGGAPGGACAGLSARWTHGGPRRFPRRSFGKRPPPSYPGPGRRPVHRSGAHRVRPDRVAAVGLLGKLPSKGFDYASVERTFSTSSRIGTSIATTPSIGSAAGRAIAASACLPMGSELIFRTAS